MTQTVPATCVLGPGKTGLTIGLRVLNLDGTTYAAFATTGVTETSTAGTYRKAGGVVVPAAGGYIVWGEAATDYAEATVDSTSVNVTMQAGVAVAAADANGSVPVVLYPTQGAVTFGQVKILADVANEGALHVVNNHPAGHGQHNYGGLVGQRNYGSTAGQENYGGTSGQANYGSIPVVGAASQEIADALKRAPVAGAPETGSVYDLLGDAAIDPQAVRDAMKLAPSAGDPAAGSVDAHLDAVALEATAQAILVDTGTTLPALIAGVTAPSAEDVADAVWDEALSGHSTPGSTGAALSAAGDPWSVELPGSYLSDQAGGIIGRLAEIDTTAVTATVSSLAGHLAIVAARTFAATVSGLTIPSDWAAAIWTLKTSASEADDAALVRLRASNPSDLEADGLERLNGAALSGLIQASDGSLTVDQAGGSVAIWLSDELTALLAETTGLGWDVKFIDDDDDSSGVRGTADVALTETWLTA